MTRRFDHWRPALAAVAPWVAIALALWPFSTAGFFFDDMHNSVLKGAAISRGLSFQEIVAFHLNHWVLQEGRYFPLSVLLGTATWWIADSLIVAQVVRATLAALNVIVFYRLICELTQDKRLARIAVLCLALVLQFNPRWDGLTSFLPLVHLTVLFTLGCWLSLCWAYRAKNPAVRGAMLLLSCASALFALHMYEVGIIAPLGGIALSLRSRQSGEILTNRAAAGLIAITGAYIAAYLYFRLTAHGGYNGIQLGLGMAAPWTFVSQFASALPLAFLNNHIRDIPANITLYSAALAPPFLLAWISTLTQSPEKPGRSPREMPSDSITEGEAIGRSTHLILASLLCIVPAAIISISSRYQAIVSYGDPYIVVYIQYFGAALTMAVAIRNFLAKATYKFAAVGVALAISLVSAFTVASNAMSIDAKNDKFKKPRHELESILTGSFFRDIPAGATLLVDSPYPWESDGAAGDGLCSDFFSHHLKRPIRCQGLPKKAAPGIPFPTPSASALFILRRDKDEASGHSITLKGDLFFREARIADGTVTISEREDGGSFMIHWLGRGFYNWEKGPGIDFVWATPISEIHLWNPFDQPRDADLTMTLQSAVEQTVSVRHGSIPISVSKTAPFEPITVRKKILASPGLNTLTIMGDGEGWKPPGDPRIISHRLLRLTLTD